jgi:hypothetical protein
MRIVMEICPQIMYIHRICPTILNTILLAILTGSVGGCHRERPLEGNNRDIRTSRRLDP